MSNYQALNTETLSARLGPIPAIAQRLGNNPENWSSEEVGDGNLNLVFIVKSGSNTIIVKQALPYVRVVGEGWPLSVKRSFFEYHALSRQQAMDPGRVPEIFYYDEQQALIAMEFLSPHVILRHSLINGVRHDALAQSIGEFTARTAFLSSDLAMDGAQRKQDLALFAANAEMCELTENVVFTDPYFAAELNQHTSPQLDALVAELRRDAVVLVEAQHLKKHFCSHAESLMHGDLHTGSIMADQDSIKIIDPEFAAYGPCGFDIGMYLGNLLMAYFAQRGHEAGAGERDGYRGWILSAIARSWKAYRTEFSQLWHTQRRGILYPDSVFSQQGVRHASEYALSQRLTQIWQEALGFAAVEMHRRTLGIAHIIEFATIEDPDLRASCEAKAIRLGRYMLVNRRHIGDIDHLVNAAQQLEQSNAVCF